MNLAALEHSAERLSALVDQTDAERETRNRLICEAMDAGGKYGEVARAAGLRSVSTVAAIIAKGYE